jgi:hypothetical protein
MAFDRFLIAPFKTGLETDLRAWLILDDAFTELQNSYVFRGRVRKRFGSVLIGQTPLSSRLRVEVGVTTTGALSGTVPGTSAVYGLIGQAFSVLGQFFTVYQTGAGVKFMLSTGVGSGTFDLSDGDFAITGTGVPDNTPVYWYPDQPVMGITQYESGSINNHPTYAFDIQFAYKFTPGVGWSRSGSGTAPEWYGNNTNYFWAVNWQGSTSSASSPPVLFVTNFHAKNPNGGGDATDDPIWWTPDNGSIWKSIATNANNGFYFLPNGSGPYAGPFVLTARIILAFKNRLLFLNTIENSGTFQGGTNTNYVNRCRYSFNGSPFAVNAWYEPNQSDGASPANVAAGAGYIDATTEEQIISAEFIKDRLIVYFERSTWELAYTGNEILPFIWQKINTELGSQSTFSTVPFDKNILTIGNTGVHACTGANVERIDNKIPDKIFEDFSAAAASVIRTAGIRDYFVELVYWAFVTTTAESQSPQTQIFPNQLLVYNYKNDSWALNDDCFTTFGYFEQQSDVTWASSAPTTWEQFNGTWISGINDANQRQIAAGTPEGFVLLISPDQSRNAPSLQITDMTLSAGIITLTVISHNLAANGDEFSSGQDYILIENVIADMTTMTALNGMIFPVYSVVDVNTITIVQLTLPSITYYGGGTIARVSNIRIYTKQFNPYDKTDTNVYIHKVDFGIKRTANGQITVDYYPSATEVSMIEGGTATGAIMGNNILETSAYDPIYYPLEQYQERLWHPVYFQSDGECIQLILYMSQAQLTNPSIALSDFELEGMILYTCKTSSRMQ